MTRSIFNVTPQPVDPEGYPVAAWSEQRARYWEYWRHFDGDWLDDAVSESDSSPKFPLKLNPFNMACLLHAGFLYGEVSDSTEPLVSTVIEPWGRDSSQEQRDAAARLTDLVNRVWCENSGCALQQEAGLISQILGGCVYGVDEGSQRSGMTLVLRMLPLVVHIRQERTLQTAGLDQVARMILAIAAEKSAVRRVGTSRSIRGGIGRLP